MIDFIEIKKYRKDIDGLRAIAVIAVILFHFGYLSNGYLGVDVFFVISGYLITKIIYKESLENRFSIANFYSRRIRRIIPLVTFINLVALIVGLFTMLPDDLENLAQSIIATTFFSNNILQILTTADYWDVYNEFKPLMHTWSLGVEEQYYLFYPLLFIIFKNKRIKWILPILALLTVVSIFLFLSPYYSESEKFYLLQFRFFELSVGGLSAIILKQRLIINKYLIWFLLGLLLILCFNFFSAKIELFITVILTLIVLVSSNDKSKLSRYFLQNKLMIFIGKISFSLYMWHQLVLAYTRYFVIQELSVVDLIICFIITFGLSIFTYYFIEQPFRNKKIGIKKLLWILGVTITLTSGASFYIYLNAGVLKDIPELDIDKNHIKRNMHAQYNARVYNFDKLFYESTSKTKILVIGNSFARDWVNVLLESKFNDTLDIVYYFDLAEVNSKIIDNADYIFFSEMSKEILIASNFDLTKVWCVGTKNFGVSNGIYYNNKEENYCEQRTQMENGYLEKNKKLKFQWKNRYINLIELVIDKNNTVPVFTQDCKFISQDCRHFTKAGAKYFASILEGDIEKILNK